jgi:TolB protein
VLDNVNWAVGNERSWLAVADNGTAVYVPGNPGDRHLVSVDRQGQVTQLTGEADLVHQATLSRDGRRVLHGGLRSQWITDLVTGTRTRIVSDVRSWHGGWLPGDDRIALSSNKDGDWDLFSVSASGGGLQSLLKKRFAQHVQAVAPDGSIIYMERNPATGSDLWLLAPDGRSSPLVVTPYNETSASVSADGRFMAYVSDESGRNDIYVAVIAGTASRTMVSLAGGSGPVWSRDGRELFYRAGDDLVSVQVTTLDPFGLGERRKLLDLSRYDPGYFHEFDVSPDGQRFLLIRTEAQSRPTRLDVMLNWFPQLKRLVEAR